MINFLFNIFRRESENQPANKYMPKDTYIKIMEFLKDINKQNIVIVCIGTNRTNIIDFLGPFVGSILKEDKKFNIPTYGTMVDPIHGLNLVKKITEIKNSFPNHQIIAIDAALSDKDQIGRIYIKNGSAQPGAGVGSNYTEVGDICIEGVVAPKNINVQEYSADMQFISAMAYTIAKGIKESFS